MRMVAPAGLSKLDQVSDTRMYDVATYGGMIADRGVLIL